MKQISKKPMILMVVLLSFMVLFCGVMSLAPNVIRAEEAEIGTQNQSIRYEIESNRVSLAASRSNIGSTADGELVHRADMTVLRSNSAGNFLDADLSDDIFTIENIPALALLAVLALVIICAIVLLVIAIIHKNDVPAAAPEQAPAKEEPVEESSEEPVEEETEEAAEEESVEEAPEEEPVEEAAEEEEAPVETKNESTATIIPIITAPEETPTAYDYSLSARISQAPDEIKGRYSDLKNHILSYKKVHSRLSWKFDSFNMGREKLCRIQLKGNNLYMYIALDPDSLESRYHVKSVKDKARFAEIPSKLRIKSARSLGYAKELVDMLMTKLNIPANEKYVPHDFAIPAMTEEELLNEGLIKVKQNNGRSFNTFAPKTEIASSENDPV